MPQRRAFAVWVCGLASLGIPGVAYADWDVTFLAGSAFPTYEERLVARVPPLGSLPGIDVSADRDLELSADGELTFGAAVAWEFAGFIALEGRFDTAEVQLETQGVNYTLSVDSPGIPSLTATLAVGAGAFDLERLRIVSGNIRLRTPGAVSIFASGGVSYLPRLEVENGIPLQLRSPSVPSIPIIDGSLTLVAQPTEEDSRFGLNGGAGLRIGFGGPIALLAEARIFYFERHELTFDAGGSVGQEFVDELVERLPSVRFNPFLYSVSGGLLISF